MTTNADPYSVPLASDTDDPNSPLFEATLTAAKVPNLDIGAGIANCEVYNGTIPGPIFKVNMGDSLVVRLKNQLDRGTGIHWHGVEMANKKDGTPFTQNHVPPGGTYLYKLRCPRAGLYWYHPHHEDSTNQAFRGSYGAIVVTDQNLEQSLGTKLPSDTQILVLSDITVCKQLGANDNFTFPSPSTLPWVGGGTLPAQPQGLTPVQLCETGPLTNGGNPGGAQFGEGEVPNIQQHGPGATAEGQTVLTNGFNAGHRGGSPTDPGMPIQTLPLGTPTRPVTAGQGLRLQIFNTATTRYFRLILTKDDQTPVFIYRIGGEGGLLNQAVLEGGITQNGFDTQINPGEILLGSGSRADCVVTIPSGLNPGDTLTMWTQDFQRTGAPPHWANLPTVPVMHLKVQPGLAQTFSLDENTILRTGNTADDPLVEVLANGTGVLDPGAFGKDGIFSADINLTTPSWNPPQPFGIDGIVGAHHETLPYTASPKTLSARYVKDGDVVQLTVKNKSTAHHPFHLHGFSMQPKSLTDHPAAAPDFIWPYDEFRDTIDIPPGYKLTFLVKIESQRPHVDDLLPGGSMGRWLFHCHIFFHAHLGMMSELIVTDANGKEKPYVDVNGSWAYAQIPGLATRTGTFAHPDTPQVNLVASEGILTVDNVNKTWSWSLDTTNDVPRITYVYITATDSDGRTDQCVFRLKVGGSDDGADTGDPHIHTIDGKRYDFQAAGEFTLLRDTEEGMEIQARQTPVKAANPVTDGYSGLRTCVSVNTAVAARVGRHVISYQPSRELKRLLFFLDGRPVDLPRGGVDLGPHRVTASQVQGASDDEIRIDYANGTVVIITPAFWSSYGIHYFNVSVAHTQAEDGIMGRIPRGTWLPLLPSGGSVGEMPADLDDRFVTLYRTFADAWRVTKKTSLFTYEPGTSTLTFTDREWPSEQPPCRLQEQFEVLGANPPAKGLTVEAAGKACRRVRNGGLNQDCVFDVATTGDVEFVRGYEVAQELRDRGTAVQVFVIRPRSDTVIVTAIVSSLFSDAVERPRGKVTFVVDGIEVGTRKLDGHCRTGILLRNLPAGEHRIRADYQGGGKSGPRPSSSPNLIHVVGRPT